MTSVEQVLSATLIAFVSGMIGKCFGGKSKVNENTCVERRGSCSSSILHELTNLTKIVDRLEKAVNNKLLGL